MKEQQLNEMLCCVGFQGSADRATRATNSPWLRRNRLKKKSGRSENFQKIKKKKFPKSRFLCIFTPVSDVIKRFPVMTYPGYCIIR